MVLVAVLTTVALAGCDRPALSPNGVVAVFGEVGMSPGQFAYPRALTVAPDGAIFVVDKAGRIQRFATDSRHQAHYETEWVMPEIAGGKPVGLSMHPDGRLFVADTHYNRVMIFDREGQTLGTFGKPGTGSGEFELPTDVAFDAQGCIYVGEYCGNDRITKWSADFAFMHVIGGDEIEGVRLRRPAGLGVDAEQTLWVADACNHRIVRFSLDGEVLAVFGTYGSEPGQMRYPYDLCITPDDTIMVCEYEGNRLQWFSKSGKSLRIWGGSGRAIGRLDAPWGAAYGPDGLVYVADARNSRIQVIRP